MRLKVKKFMANILRQILYVPFYNLLIFFAFLTNGSIGWAIIIVTLIIRAALWWPSIKAQKATTKMQALQPQMNEIKEKHKGDTKKINEETMKLYKEAGANPLGCCGPMVIQLVVIFILYRVFFIGFDTANYNLLYSFTPRPEVLQNVFFGIDLSKPELWILPILAGVTQLVLSMMTIPKTDPTKKADPMMMMNKQMTFIFPIMTIFIARSLASGLALYWVVTTLFSIGQQYYINKVIKKDLPSNTSKKTSSSPVLPEKEQPQVNEAASPAKKKDMMTKVIEGRLNKQDKKKGVEVTIRQKK